MLNTLNNKASISARRNQSYKLFLIFYKATPSNCLSSVVVVNGDPRWNGAANIAWTCLARTPLCGIFLPIAISPLDETDESDPPPEFTEGGGIEDHVDSKVNYATNGAGQGSSTYNAPKVREVQDYTFQIENYSFDLYDNFMGSLDDSMTESEVETSIKSYVDTIVPDMVTVYDNEEYMGGNPPNSISTVSNPNPSDGSGGISISLSQLSFDISDNNGDLMDYTVETSPDAGGTSGTNVADGTYSFSINGLDYNTVYPWYVNVTDGQDWTRRSFSFTTGSAQVNHPPYTPGNPDPYNGETGVDVNHNLDWAGGDRDGDTVYYDVYFGTDSTPDSGEFKTATTSSNYNPGMLNEGTTYYWRINAFDEHGEPANPQGSTWHFTTESTPVNQPPVANFVYSPTNPGVLDEIYFTDTSFDSDGYIDSWYWEFDDGDTSTLQNPAHQYTSDGTYLVNLIVTDDNGGTDTMGKTITVSTSTAEMLDQEQTTYTYDFVAYGSRWGAQSFKPTLDTLTRVELFVGKTGSPDNMIVSIRDNPYGNDLTSVSVPAGNIPTSSGWVFFDFPDLSVTPGSTYYIVARTGGSGYPQYYKIGFTLGNPYAFGSLWYSGNAGSNWIQYIMYDFCFKTYGT